jgi:hypothetical protein
MRSTFKTDRWGAFSRQDLKDLLAALFAGYVEHQISEEAYLRLSREIKLHLADKGAK